MAKSFPKNAPGRLRTGDIDVVRIGAAPLLFRDLYVSLLSTPWIPLVAMVALFYLISNLAFACAYYAIRGGIENANSFADVFFFSVQTMATIGYGHMSPVSNIANVLVTIEAVYGFIYFAFVAGLMFAKFSRPTAQVLFSDIAVISNFDGKPYLKIRLANRRNNRIVDVTAKLFLLRQFTTKEGFSMRRFIDLKVEREYMPMLRLTWTLMHPVDEDSPFYGMSKEDFKNVPDEIFVTLVGLDDTLSTTIHARHSYFVDEILHDTFFEDVIKRGKAAIEVNYNNFHSVRKTPPDAMG